MFDSTNTALSKLFYIAPLKIHYVLTDSTDMMLTTVGYTFEHLSMFSNIQYGGFSEPLNSLIMAGNSSETYVHELYHLYIYKVYSEGATMRTFHEYADEGIATLFGGSRGLSLAELLKIMHDDVLKRGIDFTDLLRKSPKGNSFSYSYVIGGLFAKILYDKYGMLGLYALLKSGTSDEAYYLFIEQKIGVKRENLDSLIRNELKKYAR